jgi:hypothetical protein
MKFVFKIKCTKIPLIDVFNFFTAVNTRLKIIETSRLLMPADKKLHRFFVPSSEYQTSAGEMIYVYEIRKAKEFVRK